MDNVLWFGRSYLVPGSPMFLVLGVAAGVALLGSERTAAWGRRALGALVFLYMALSLPVVSSGVARMLGGVPPLDRADAVRASEAIVLIGCGALSAGSKAEPVHFPGVETALNISEAVRLYRMAGGHKLVVTGGIPPGGANRIPESEVILGYLLNMGVARKDIVLDPEASNTLQQARNVAALLPKGSRIVLVTTPTHMPRTSRFFRAEGFDVTPAVSGLARLDETATLGSRFVPNRYSLRASENAMYEVVALTYYWARGDFGR